MMTSEEDGKNEIERPEKRIRVSSKSQQCFEKWAYHLSKNKYYPLQWNLIESDLANNVQHNEQLKQQIFCCTPDDIEFENADKEEIYTKLYNDIKARNEAIFDDLRSVIHFILFSNYSPLSIAIEPKSSEIKCTDFDTNVDRILDCIKILSLLTKYDIITGYDTPDDIRRALDKLEIQSTKYRNAIMQSFIHLIVSMNNKQKWALIRITLNVEGFKKSQQQQQQQRLGNESNEFKEIIDDEFSLYGADNYLKYRYYSKYAGWRIDLQTRTDIVENLLFRGIEPMRIVLERNNREIFDKMNDIDTKNIEINNIETDWNIWIDKLLIANGDNVKLSKYDKKQLLAVISPFIIYPFFENAKMRMNNLLIDHITMNNDCITVIMQYLFIPDSNFADYYHKYKENLLCKSMEFLVYLDIIDNIEKNKYFQNIFNERFDDAIFLKFLFDNFESDIMDHMNKIEFWTKILLKYLSNVRLSVFGYYKLLSKVIDRFMYNSKRLKHSFKQYMEILSSPLLNDKDISDILNYSDEDNHTLLISTISSNLSGILQKHEMQIIDTLLSYKQIDINIRNLNTYSSHCHSLFHYVAWNHLSLLCSKLLKTKKIPIREICASINICVKKEKWISYDNSARIVALKIGKYLTNFQRINHKKLNTKDKKLINSTAKRIRKFLRRHRRFTDKSDSDDDDQS